MASSTFPTANTVSAQVASGGGLSGDGSSGNKLAISGFSGTASTEVLFNSTGSLAGSLDHTWIPIGTGNASGGGGLLVGPIAGDVDGWAYGQAFNVSHYTTDLFPYASISAAILTMTGDFTESGGAETIGLTATIKGGGHTLTAPITLSSANTTGYLNTVTVTDTFSAHWFGGTVADDATVGTFNGAAIFSDVAGHATLYTGFWAKLRVDTTGVVTKTTPFYAAATAVDGGGAVTTNVAYWAEAQGGSGTNAYAFWADEQGVFRIRADNTFNSVYQAIPALYNPQVTKYTPGAADYERIIMGQWASNIAQIGTEKGGTGTLREVQLIGAGLLTNATLIPTADPHVVGQVWNNSGVMTISAG